MRTFTRLVVVAILLSTNAVAQTPGDYCETNSNETTVVVALVNSALPKPKEFPATTCRCESDECLSRKISVSAETLKEGTITVHTGFGFLFMGGKHIGGEPPKVLLVFEQAKADKLFQRVFTTGAECHYSFDAITTFACTSWDASKPRLLQLNPPRVTWNLRRGVLKYQEINAPLRQILEDDLSNSHRLVWDRPWAKRFRKMYPNAMAKFGPDGVELRDEGKWIKMTDELSFELPLEFMQSDVAGWAEFADKNIEVVAAAKRDGKWVSHFSEAEFTFVAPQ